MAEAIISRRHSNVYKEQITVFKTEVLTDNQNWIVPEAINNSFSVRLFGGGGGGRSITLGGTGGGSGWMENGTFELYYGLEIPITIGAGGGMGAAGGTTSFGTYLSAVGGEAGTTSSGGNGGAGGGAGGVNVRSVAVEPPVSGGNAYQFGSGGGCQANAGPWGGSGGSVSISRINNISWSNGTTWRNNCIIFSNTMYTIICNMVWNNRYCTFRNIITNPYLMDKLSNRLITSTSISI